MFPSLTGDEALQFLVALIAKEGVIQTLDDRLDDSIHFEEVDEHATCVDLARDLHIEPVGMTMQILAPARMIGEAMSHLPKVAGLDLHLQTPRMDGSQTYLWS